jgi:hypothetical protein
LVKANNRVIAVKPIVDTLHLAMFNDGLSMSRKLEVYEIAAANAYLLRNRVFKI